MKNTIKYTIIFIIFIAAFLAIIFVVRYFAKLNRPVIQGVVECRTYRASSKIAGRIDSLFVAEGDWVAQGELLYTLSTPELDAKLRQVVALESAAEAINLEVDRGARREQIEAARSMWQKAMAGQELAERSFERVKNLYEKGVVPRQQYDEALANVEAMRATVRAARAEYDLAMEGATKEQREAMAAKVREAQGAVSEVESYIRDARVYAPISGRVADIVSEPGELVGVGFPVVAILDLEDCWVTFNIRESDLHGIDVGYRFTGYVPALRENVDFEIYYISAEADFATWSATRARGGFNIRTFEVRAREVSGRERLLPGMSVVVYGDRL